MWLVPHACNSGKLAKLVMQPETDVGSELLLTSFDVTHHGQSTSHPDIRERVRESKMESLKPLTKMILSLRCGLFLCTIKGFQQLCEGFILH